MASKKIDILIIGAGIAGLWTFQHLRSLGYSVLLLEKNGIGGVQTLASQGIIHSGLKYALAGKVNSLAKSIASMPDKWRSALNGTDPVNLSSVQEAAASQHLLIPKGITSGIQATMTKKTLGDSVHEITKDHWPAYLTQSGFKGKLIDMDELVLNIPDVVRALSEPYLSQIRKIDGTLNEYIKNYQLSPRIVIHTSADDNMRRAQRNDHHDGLTMQIRPLVQGLLRPAPFPLYAHLIGMQEKPVATITTHRNKDGQLIWYFGGQVAERAFDSPPEDVFKAIRKALQKYLPDVDLSKMEWSVYPVNRYEGKTAINKNHPSWLPNTPTIHRIDNHLYCWPTKLTFTPMLADDIVKTLKDMNISPSGQQHPDYSELPEIGYTNPPWDNVQWRHTS